MSVCLGRLTRARHLNLLLLPLLLQASPDPTEHGTEMDATVRHLRESGEVLVARAARCLYPWVFHRRGVDLGVCRPQDQWYGPRQPRQPGIASPERSFEIPSGIDAILCVVGDAPPGQAFDDRRVVKWDLHPCQHGQLRHTDAQQPLACCGGGATPGVLFVRMRRPGRAASVRGGDANPVEGYLDPRGDATDLH